MNNITIYTTNTCPYCVMLKNFLNSQRLPYKEVNVQADPVTAQWLVSTTGRTGVPQAQVNGNWVIGYDPDSIMRFVKAS